MKGGKKGERWMSGHLCTGEEVGVSLDPRNDLTQDDTIGEYVSLKTDGHTLRHANTKKVSTLVCSVKKW